MSEWLYYPNRSGNPKKPKTALIGWSLQAIEAIDKLNKPFIVVAPTEFQSFAKKYNIPFIDWDFGNDHEPGNDEVSEHFLKESNFKSTLWFDQTKSNLNAGETNKHSKIEAVNGKAEELYKILRAHNVNLAIALFEDTVEWAGALNARFMQDPTIFDKSLLENHYLNCYELPLHSL